jgi:hypothetical protein
MSDDDKKDQQPDPSTYMRSRHPDLYSDSKSGSERSVGSIPIGSTIISKYTPPRLLGAL